jgi:phosphoribosyl 1,2-cyclic phosphodiesterase
MKNESFSIKFWGVRGSHPVSGPETAQYGGNTACVEISAGQRTLILDAGSGLIALGRDLTRRARQAQKAVDVVFLFSHLHHDHTQGFPFFAPVFSPATNLHLYGPVILGKDIEQTLAAVMNQPYFPVAYEDLASLRSAQNIFEKDLLQIPQEGNPVLTTAANAAPIPDAIRVRCMRSYGHPGGVWIYRIEWRGRSVVYATDTEGYAELDQRLVKFAEGADLLIHDSQYTDQHYLGQKPGLPTTQGYGHSTVSMACRVAQAAHVGQLALFHYDPSYADSTLDEMAGFASGMFHQSFAPREGQEIDLPVEPVLALA